MKGNTQYHFNPEASAFHEEFRQLFIRDPRLNKLKAYQEVNVRDLVPDYPERNHHFDFYIEELGLIVELHGKQHYQITRFGSGKSMDDLIIDFRRSQHRDNMKATAARSAGLRYISIPYTCYKKLSYDLFIEYLGRAS